MCKSGEGTEEVVLIPRSSTYIQVYPSSPRSCKQDARSGIPNSGDPQIEQNDSPLHPSTTHTVMCHIYNYIDNRTYHITYINIFMIHDMII